jgi:hypothetical protein
MPISPSQGPNVAKTSDLDLEIICLDLGSANKKWIISIFGLSFWSSRSDVAGLGLNYHRK